MSETKMPATEAADGVDEQAFASYEFAYHVLPTVADGEVADVRDRVAAAITNAGGEIFDEETPQHIDLAYDIDKYLEGKHRKFSTAYFGWIRFRTERSQIDGLTEVVDADKALLRYLLLRLTKLEEAMPFYFHQARADEKQVETVGEELEDIDPNAEPAAVDTTDVADDSPVIADTETVGTDQSDDATTEEVSSNKTT